MSKVKSAYLEKEGPTIGILVLPPLPIVEQMKVAGEIPSARHLRAIIDTGAESSCISIKTLEELNLVPRNFRPRISTQGKEDQPIYDAIVQIQFSETLIPVDFYVEIAGLGLDQFGIYALLGRDILRHCELNYNGKLGTYSLRFIGDQKT